MSSRSRLDSAEARRAAEVVQGVPGGDDSQTAAVPDPAGLVCPLPLDEYPAVTLAHGGGGKFSRMLTEKVFLAAFGPESLGQLHDGAVLEVGDERLAFSTDTFVIDPPFFPGGDIGALAVHGTVNDLAMCGARPLVLSAGFILEEGFPMEDLWTLATSMQRAAERAGVRVVTGDTKVVDRGKGDGVFINTSGVGRIPDGVEIAPRRARPGDAVLVSGPIATHGIAIMSVREGLEFETALETDSAPLWPLVESLMTALGPDLHVLRDPTRGGVASAVNEIADSAGVGIRLDEAAIPVEDPVRGACEILGLDPLYVANEGKLVAIVAGDRAEYALAALRAHPLGRDAAVIGTVTVDHPGRVFQRSRIGGTRVVEMLSGEQLPRIC
ncbi:MAG: hydrogenase expression/formation protein HypE [Gemmatimonadota bacterium]